MQHLPFDWRQILNRGFNLFDYTNTDTPAIHLIKLPTLPNPSHFLLIGEENLKWLNDPNYRFNDVVTYLNAVELYHYICLKNNRYRKMNDYFITVVDPTSGIYTQVISKSFRKFINK